LLLIEWEQSYAFAGLDHHRDAGPDAGDAGDTGGKAGFGAKFDNLIEDSGRGVSRGEHKGLAGEISNIDGSRCNGVSFGHNGDDGILMHEVGDQLGSKLRLDSAGKADVDLAVDERLPLTG
jgi:hypothetical protein